MRIQVRPDAREGLLEFLRRAHCEVRSDGDETLIVEVPDALGEEQARLEVDLYLKAWQASHPTSAARSPRRQKLIAMAVVAKTQATPATTPVSESFVPGSAP